jgi:hypothetical protein
MPQAQSLQHKPLSATGASDHASLGQTALDSYLDQGPMGDNSGSDGLRGADSGPLLLSVPRDALAGHQGNSGGTGSGSTVFAPTSSSSVSPFVINITWDASVASAPVGFTAGVTAAVQWFESHIVTPVTVNIDIGWGEVGGVALSSNELAASGGAWQGFYTASQMDAYLKNSATSTADQTAYGYLPTAAPAGTSGYWVQSAQAKALGMKSASTAVDGYVGFNSGYSFTYNDTTGVAGGTYDLVGIAEHEVSEVLGRVSGLGPSGSNAAPSPIDMFRYSAPGAPNFTFGTASYFSIDGGATNLANFNAGSSGDTADWASGTPVSDAANAFATAGVVCGMSTADLTALDVIGWTTAGAVAPAPAPATAPVSSPTGVSLSPATTSLATAQSLDGLSTNGALANVTQVGGATGDSYSYTLGGTAAAAFTLSTTNNTLSAGLSGVTGAANGNVFALTLSATDQTSGNSSPAIPVDVVVGSGGNDTIQLATLVGAVSTGTPTFVYGLGGADRIDATGMTGKLWLDGGAGADVMTGGSGVNEYMYGAAGDSTAVAMDIITNFHAGADLIDLTGLGTSLSYAGLLPATTGGHGKGHTGTNLVLPAHSVGWQSSGGNTFVYGNTSGSAESVAGADIKIELQGSVSLVSGNFLHL